MPGKFIRKTEDFLCANCGFEVVGNGYTNHCPKCLWSKHVDVNPGDRMSGCGAMMEPVRVEGRIGDYSLVHRCVKCGYEKMNKVSKEDGFEKVIEISKNSEGRR